MAKKKKTQGGKRSNAGRKSAFTEPNALKNSDTKPTNNYKHEHSKKHQPIND